MTGRRLATLDVFTATPCAGVLDADATERQGTIAADGLRAADIVDEGGLHV